MIIMFMITFIVIVETFPGTDNSHIQMKVFAIDE